MAENSRSVESFLVEIKRDLLASVAEFLGTTVFLLMGLGGIQAAAISNEAAKEASRNSIANEVASVSQLLYISTSMSLALLASAWTFFRISGSVFNPNVAIALAMTGALKPIRFFLYVVAEVLAGITASAILNAILPGSLAVGCGLGVETKVWQGLVIEALLTGILTITVLFLAVEKHRATPFAPVAIGLVLFATHMFGVVFTGAAMNSARAFGPDVITGFKSYHWIYWIGPSIGSIVAAMIYLFLKSVEYESFNPKQDSDQVHDSPDLQGIEVKMRRRNTHYEKNNEFGYPAGGAQNPMPANFGLVSAPFPTSIYRGNMTDVCAPANPLPYESSRPQSPALRPRNGAPSISGGMSTIASARQLNTKGFSHNGAHIEHHENVDRTEELSPMTDGFVHERRTQNPTGSVC
ncbi:hypothetical protein PGT21_036059 [Puccinia graminis f. sp. tritici]|uniref:Aquaporin n=2 Tax=Puccinia graminis f. sp. tritici TaxID=56615 RepID=E3KKW4_PUCGT|nr:uncharacterized protein PGTG_10410 [Puccinia graminis f. sp. tritici CRL 75-36-700-3]EFP84939.2 hypothetical protein PGTG_10410 [Puccinia graminis f. sp. tritici CRL 75-36-700-3]KAA1087718.1 hypothetical protein PGT21_036059 [Puccinia graminis f. sp. tritici]